MEIKEIIYDTKRPKLTWNSGQQSLCCYNKNDGHPDDEDDDKA